MKKLAAVPALLALLFAGVASAQSYYYPSQNYSYQNYSYTYPYSNTYYGSSYYPGYSYPNYNYGYYPYYQNYDPPTIDEVDGPTSLDEGERGIWRLDLDAAYGSYVTVSIDWDDDRCNNYYYPYNYNYNYPYNYYNYGSGYNYGYNYNYGNNYGCEGNTTQSYYIYGTKSLTFAHTYFDEGTYDVRFTVRGMYGNADTETDRVRVDNDNNDDDDDDLSIEVTSGPSTLDTDAEGTWSVRVE